MESQQAGVAALAREIEEFMAAGGWNQPPQLFALVPTAALLDEQPELAGQLDRANPLTPVAQEALPDGDLAEALARIAWPDLVIGCALAQEIIVLPPGSESELPDVAEAGACVMRLRGIGTAEGTDESVDEVIESPDLAPNLLDALKATLLP
jgi:hypothetical protein